MSCENNSGRISRSAAIAAGVPAVASQSGILAGMMMARLNRAIVAAPQTLPSVEAIQAGIDRGIDRLGQTASPPISAVVNFMRDGQKREAGRWLITIASGTLNAARAGLTTAATSSPLAGVEKAADLLAKSAKQAGKKGDLALPTQRPFGPVTPETRVKRKLRQTLLEAATARLGTSLAEATKTRDAGTVTQTRRRLLFFKKDEAVPFWQSKLTGPLNRLDVIGTINGQNIISSRGVMLKVGQVTWHRGATVVQMPAGKRTIIHLQSLKAPGTHHFFDRPLSDEQAAGIAAGLIKPEMVPGFVGSISQKEALMPAWAQLKRFMILTRLHWPPTAQPAKSSTGR